MAGAEKWEREHPRRPHHALVRDRFGSWRAALQAAGLPTAPPLAIPRRERVQTAQRREGRLSADELADLLGVTARTMRSYWHAGTCARCGGPQISPRASSNALAAAGLRAHRRAWTRQDIRLALRGWAALHGCVPHHGDWEAGGPGHPPASTVVNVSGS